MSIIAAAETIVRRLGRKVAASSRSTKRSIAMLSDALAIPACLGGAVWLIAPELLTILPLWLWCFAFHGD
jgi:hypothetical protein